MSTQTVLNLRVGAKLLGADADQAMPQPAVYIYSASDRLIARDVLGDNLTTSLSLPAPSEASFLRVLVGPDLNQKQVAIAELKRRGAEEKLLRYDPRSPRLSAEFIIPATYWQCWLKGLCFVRGKLLQKTQVGDSSVDRPVCNATVEVYEVDPIYRVIPRLPDVIIERLRDIILDPPIPPIDPIPDPPIGPEPLPFDPALAAAESPVLQLERSLSATSARRPVERAQLSSITSNLSLLAKTTNTLQFRQVLIDNLQLVRPILCRYFPRYFSLKLVATAKTDDCGAFRTLFSRGCKNTDQPDLYFKAKQRRFPFLNPITIYAPTPVPCHTYWNYACGTEVTLYTQHPFAITCDPCPPVIAPNNWVLIDKIGRKSLSEIYGASQTLQATTTAQNKGLTQEGAPWGGTLQPIILFDPDLRQTHDVKYYRVSWRRLTNANLVPIVPANEFQPLNEAIAYRFFYERPVDDKLIEAKFVLGPQDIGGTDNLYEIPPALPRKDGQIGTWSQDLRVNAKFPTSADTYAPGMSRKQRGTPGPFYSGEDFSGKYQLKVELFKSDGSRVDGAEFEELGINYRVPQPQNPLVEEIETDAAADLGLVNGADGSFTLTLHVDNNPCYADLLPPTINQEGSDVGADDCGVLPYASNSQAVKMTYNALHPHGFATYNYNLFQGAQRSDRRLTPPSSSGDVSPTTLMQTSTVGELRTLISNPSRQCPTVGLAQTLGVIAQATDGLSRLSSYDHYDVQAFVLSPEEAD
ncbi:hypothetical protein [Sphaerothrix gracilis]|uniref:hypothetical protein n=1 Tax=Sphaerothrix gracilis TaxID=3151835 RepID=UPI0031FCDB55